MGELSRPASRASSTPVSAPLDPLAPPKEDDKLLYHTQPIDHQTLEMLKRSLLYNQLLQAGYPEHIAQQHLQTALLREKYMEESNKHSPISTDADRRQPQPAHSSLPYRQTDSPMFHVPAPAHSNSQLPYHLQNQMIHPSPHHEVYRPPGQDQDIVPPVAHSGQIKRLAHAGGITDFSSYKGDQHQQMQEPAGNLVDLMTSYRMPHLAAYPICWSGILSLKNELANVQMHYVSGCRDLAKEYLPQAGAQLKIEQRMRLEDTQIDGVKKKMETKSEHCLLLALPHGNDQDQFEGQSRILRNNFITYLQLKNAAGIANIRKADNQSVIVHVFPSCDFANENLARIT